MTLNSLPDRVTLITGASRGLGKAIALEVAKEGATLALIHRDEAKLGDTAIQTGAKAHVFQFDVTQGHLRRDVCRAR